MPTIRKIRCIETGDVWNSVSEAAKSNAVGAAKIIELLTGDVGLVKMAEKLTEVGF